MGLIKITQIISQVGKVLKTSLLQPLQRPLEFLDPDVHFQTDSYILTEFTLELSFGNPD